MLQTLVWLEVGLAAAIFLLAAAQYLGLSMARREGRTSNRSRLIAYGSLMSLTVIYAAGSLIWLRSVIEAQDITKVANLPIVNWTYLVIAIMIGMLAAWDLVNHVRATLVNEPHYKPRLLTSLAMILLLVLLVGLNLSRWQVYLDEIQDTYSDSIPTGSR